MEAINELLEQENIDETFYSRPPRYNLAIFCVILYTAIEFLFPNNSVLAYFALACMASILGILNDFILKDNSYVEIKGYWTSIVDDKLKNFQHPIRLLFKKDLEEVFSYVESQYGKNFIKFYEGNLKIKKCDCGELLFKKNKTGKCINCIRKNSIRQKNKNNNNNGIIRNKIGIKICQSCSKKIKKPRVKQINCGQCWQEQQIKNSKIPYDLELLKNQVKELGYKQVGRIYNVSDNAIKKRITKLEANRLDEEPILKIGRS